MITRRTLVAGALLAGSPLSPSRAAPGATSEARKALADLERRHGGRLGVAILDTADANLVVHRGYERFPLCSTFKVLAAGLVLARVDRGQEDLGRRVVYQEDRIVPNSPVTAKHVGTVGLTVAEICEAALTLSDNTAGNLMLDSFGGPAALTAYLRTLGDPVTRLDRSEPTLNEAVPGDPRDTTTPVAMLGLLHHLTSGTTLSDASRDRLTTWMMAAKTGDQRLRAGVPKDWRAGDKTGSGDRNIANDVAILWPPRRAPIVVTAYSIDGPASMAARNAILAEVGHVAARI